MVTEIVLVTKVDNGSGAIAIPIPAGPVGDLILIFAEAEANAVGAISFSVPAGYTPIYNLNPHNYHATAAFYKVAGASEPNPSTTLTAVTTGEVFFFAQRYPPRVDARVDPGCGVWLRRLDLVRCGFFARSAITPST